MTTENLTREQLYELQDDAEREGKWALENQIRYRLKTVCDTCKREGAHDHYDRNGIYAGRWHDKCATPSQLHVENYKWSPGDEPLDEY